MILEGGFGGFYTALDLLPRAEKKLRVALDWTLDMLFTKDLVQFSTAPPPTVSHTGEQA